MDTMDRTQPTHNEGNCFNHAALKKMGGGVGWVFFASHILDLEPSTLLLPREIWLIEPFSSFRERNTQFPISVKMRH